MKRDRIAPRLELDGKNHLPSPEVASAKWRPLPIWLFGIGAKIIAPKLVDREDPEPAAARGTIAGLNREGTLVDMNGDQILLPHHTLAILDE